jgi:hypothetical protein
MKAYWGSSFDLGSSWEWVLSLTRPATLSQAPSATTRITRWSLHRDFCSISA